jgi:hypothetical protein
MVQFVAVVAVPCSNDGLMRSWTPVGAAEHKGEAVVVADADVVDISNVDNTVVLLTLGCATVEV